MYKYFVVCAAIFCFISCSNDQQNVNIQRGLQKDTSMKASSVLFAAPQIIDSSHLVIYPLILEKTNSGIGFSSGYSSDRLSYWNLIFYNTENKSQHLLVENKKIVIYTIRNDQNSSESHRGFNSGINLFKDNIFYEAVSNDYNQNNYLENTDPTYLFISDKKGNNFRQLSPDNYHVLSWQIVMGTSKVIMEAQKDVNGDKKFDQNDPVIPLIVDISTGKMASEIFDENYLDSLKSNLTNTWKMNKK